MEISDLYNLLLSLDLPVAYHHFIEDNNNQLPSPPFIIYEAEKPNVFYADDNNFFIEDNFIIYLITENKDLKLESKLETLFSNNNIPFEKGKGDYIESERIYQIDYLI